MSPPTPHDEPFAEARRNASLARADGGERTLPMVLSHADVKATLRDWTTFSNDDPMHITVRPETDVRDVRQLPIETDPPEHADYRKLVEPFFRRPLDAAYRADMEAMIDAAVAGAVAAGEVEVVRELALPVQSRSLARMLGVGDDEAERWTSWGLHVFHDGDGVAKGAELADYYRRKFAEAGAHGDDFFAALNRATLGGRPLTGEEKEGFANLVFAGGRDTVIQSIAAIFGHLAAEPSRLGWLRADPDRLSLAVEEFLRHLSPVTMLARRCPRGATVAGEAVEPGGRVAVAYAAANYDREVFDAPCELRLDRSPNPHLAFGFGKHHCLGAAQARLVMRSLLASMCRRVGRVDAVDVEVDWERQPSHTRPHGFRRLLVRLFEEK